MRALLTALLTGLLLLGATPASAAPEPLPADLDRWDYQIGGPRAVGDRVDVVVRDREARPAGVYDVCYVNAFQTQPGEQRFWRERWSLVLKDGRGRPVVDAGWGEWLLDIRTAAKRQRLARIVGGWFAGCAADGYEAVEPDNLDSFSRSRGHLDRADARAFARLLVVRAHAADLAIAQKNWAELDGSRLGFDFAVAESCARWRECDRYATAYDGAVLAVEYDAPSFRRACARWADEVAVVRRDRAVTPRGVRRWC